MEELCAELPFREGRLPSATEQVAWRQENLGRLLAAVQTQLAESAAVTEYDYGEVPGGCS